MRGEMTEDMMSSEPSGEWMGATRVETCQAEFVLKRAKICDAARRYDWPVLLNLLGENPHHVNGWRLGGASWYTPLHQAANGGAPLDVVERLIALGAWRTLQNANGERPVDLASRKGHGHLARILEPVLRVHVPHGVLMKLQHYFHDVIRERAAEFVDKEHMRLPEIEHLLELPRPLIWFPVPGMYGGFRYALRDEGAGRYPALVAESWCRIVEGSGQRHEVTCRGSALVAEGFA